ncbi:hypothetical protein PENCOP_c004G06951 [Penicillium coprophilum]|uniref:F-box domain-containing protein n=1 Tax=Penicillium coprophilum TaxID=36646 RepID=A0A1V6UUD2_9EURO|nr:hypothetical protein PENCOP_c004G06951 [Penicillium coprophilum]
MAGSVFPPELWLMIIQFLRDEESPQHISRLAQTCKFFYQEINHVIYQSVRLRRVENARRFAKTVSSRPDLAALVKGVRHADDLGFSDFAGHSEPFYQALTKLQNLQTLVMRKEYCVSHEYTPEAALQEVLTNICYDAQDSYVRKSCLEDLMMDMEAQGYPLGSASDPFGLGFHPWGGDFSLHCWAEDLIEDTYFSRDNLKDLISALRTCHIGTDSDIDPNPKKDRYQPSLEFNETIFTLPRLQKICITGARFRKFGLPEASIDSCATDLRELLLLNCHVSTEDLELIIRFPCALQQITIRVPLSLKSPYEEEYYVFFIEELSARHSESLEYLDLDIYGGTDHGFGLDPFDVLKEIIVTPRSMTGSAGEEMILPHSLERLTIRYEDGTCLPLKSIYGELEDTCLPNLRTVICQIPDKICESTTSSEVRVEAEAFISKFKDLGVDLSTELVPYPLTMPKYDVCPCENLAFFHKFPFHPRVEPRPQIVQAATATATGQNTAPT